MTQERVGITIEVTSDDLTRLVREMVRGEKEAERLERKAREMAKALADIDKASRLSAEQMKNLGDGIAAAAGQQMVDNLFGGIVEAVKTQQRMLDGFDDTLMGVGEGGVTAAEGLSLIGGRLAAIGGVVGPVIAGLVAFGGVALAGITAAAVGLFDFVRGATVTADRMDDLAAKTGTTTEFLSRLSFGAKMSGVEIEGLHTALTTITERAASAPADFQRWGISVRDAGGAMKSTEQLVVEASEKMANLRSTSERSALAMDLFGKSGKELVPLLEGGAAGLAAFAAESDRLGGTVTSAAGALAAEFNDKLDATMISLDGVKRELASAFMPIFIRVFEGGQNVLGGFLRWIQENRKAVEQFARGAMQFLLQSFALFVDVGSKATYVAQGLVSIFTTRLNGAFATARSMADQVSTAARNLSDELSKKANTTTQKSIPAIEREAEAHQAAASAARAHGDAVRAINEIQADAADGFNAIKEALREKEKVTVEVAERELAEARRAGEAQLAANELFQRQAEQAQTDIASARGRLGQSLNQQAAAYEESFRAIIEAGTNQRIDQVRKESDARVKADQGVLAAAQKRFAAARSALEQEASTAKETADRIIASTKAVEDARKQAAEDEKKRQADAKTIALNSLIEREKIEEATQKNLLKGITRGLESGGFSSMLDAWKTFFRTKDQLAADDAEKMEKTITGSMRQMASRVTSAVMDVVSSFRQALSQVGDIETKTRQRIAIKAMDNVEKGSRRSQDAVLRYVDSITQYEMEALEKVGQRAEVVTETLSIRTKTTADAIEGVFKTMLDRILDMAISFLAQAAIMTLFSFLSGGTLGFGAALLSVVGLNKGGPVKGYAGGGFVSGGIPGRDSVPALLTPGEYVIPAPIVDDIRSGRAPSNGHYASGGGVPQGGRAGSSTTQNIVMFAGTRAALRRLKRDAVDPLDRMNRRTMVMRSVRA